jgi:hypothetical protein
MIDRLEAQLQTTIQHNHQGDQAIPRDNKEYSIGTKKVDGFDKETNTVFEFLGDFFHGALKYDRQRIGIGRKGVTMEHLYEETFKRFAEIHEQGYRIYYIWEFTFKALNEDDSLIDHMTLFDPNNWREKDRVLHKTIFAHKPITVLQSDQPVELLSFT